MPFGLPQLFRRRHAARWTLLGGLIATAVLGWELHREAVELDRQRLAMRVTEIQAQLDARLEKSEMLLHNLRDYLRLSGETREPVFQRWCYENGLTINCPWILGIAVATNRNKMPWRDLLPKNPETWTTNHFQMLNSPAKERPLDCEITLKSKVSDHKQFLPDYDLRSTVFGAYAKGKVIDRLAASIRESSRLAMSNRRAVMLDAQRNAITGTFFHVPIHSPEFDELLTFTNHPSYSLSMPRWLELESLIIAPLDFNILAQSLWEGRPADLAIEIFSSTNQTAETWMNMSERSPRAADPKFNAYLTHHQLWPMYGMKFSIFFYTTPLFEAQSPRRLAKLSIAAGVVLTLLTSALVGVAQSAQNRQERMIEQIREARDALAAAQQERNNISRDLHDGTVQSLYAIQLGLGHAAREFETAPKKGSRALLALRKELDAVIAEIRQFITTEISSTEPFDCGPVLESLVQRARAGTTTQIKLDCDASAARRLAAAQAVQLANIVREAMSNSLRHGQPRELRIALTLDSNAVVLKIVDNGRGFDPKAPPRAGVGLTSMASRAGEIGGRFELWSARDQGTRIEVRIPVRPERDDDPDAPPA
jgi:signal transduction histidine kinase